MNKQYFAVLLVAVLLAAVVFVATKKKPANASAAPIVNSVDEFQPTPLSDYDEDTIVPAHKSVCSYCQSKNEHSERRFGRYQRWHDQMDGEHAHGHRCSQCNERFVCDFHCTLEFDQKQRIEKGLKSRD